MFEFDVENIGQVSDGYHTFDELYEHRMHLFAVICNQNKNLAWKSWSHHDGSMFDDYFIVGITTPQGDYTYHYHKDYWDLFDVKVLLFGKKWDGHKPEDITRLKSLKKQSNLVEWFKQTFCKHEYEYHKTILVNAGMDKRDKYLCKKCGKTFI